jgi:hypothetical protein
VKERGGKGEREEGRVKESERGYTRWMVDRILTTVITLNPKH